jgi:ferritin-like metal-binding protein YciE
MKNASLHELFVMEIQDLHDAELQLIDALPKMAKAASSEELAEGFRDHLEQTVGHAKRLEEIAQELDFKVRGKKCVGMEGLIKEGEEIIKGLEDSLVKDLGLIAAAQKVEHYEISGYGTARAMAQQMEHDNAYDLLEETLAEESDTDEKLTDIAEGIMSELRM